GGGGLWVTWACEKTSSSPLLVQRGCFRVAKNLCPFLSRGWGCFPPTTFSSPGGGPAGPACTPKKPVCRADCGSADRFSPRCAAAVGQICAHRVSTTTAHRIAKPLITFR